jgi:hypothetical protein
MLNGQFGIGTRSLFLGSMSQALILLLAHEKPRYFLDGVVSLSTLVPER